MSIRLFFVAIAVLAIASFALASETDELREQAQAVRREAAELAERGHKQEAENLERKANAMLEEAEVLGKRRQGERRLDRRAGNGPAPHGEVAHRLEHIRIAVDHLNQAGLHDVAEQAARRAEATEMELHNHDIGAVLHEMMAQLNELRREVGRLSDEVAELKRNQ